MAARQPDTDPQEATSAPPAEAATAGTPPMPADSGGTADPATPAPAAEATPADAQPAEAIAAPAAPVSSPVPLPATPAAPTPATAAAQGGSRPPVLRFDEVRKRYGGVTAVDGVSLAIPQGAFFALLGPSGCGKTTLLRMVAGFERPDHGRVLIDGQDVSSAPPHLRPVNMMFQSYALFPHMSVERNIAFGLRQEGLKRREIASRVIEMLSLVQLEGLARRKPHQLSGGQRQRVALARALIKRPRILLLDEPLAALDRKLRQETQAQLAALQRKLGTTFVIVTHDQEEAMMLADRMAVMDRGRIVQTGAPADVYEQPASRYVAGFIGDVNLLEGRVARIDMHGAQVDCGNAGYFRIAPAGEANVGDRVTLAIRPEKVSVRREAPSDPAANAQQGTVEDIAYLGERSLYRVRVRDRLIMKASVSNLSRNVAQRARPGDRVWLTWPPEAGLLLSR